MWFALRGLLDLRHARPERGVCVFMCRARAHTARTHYDTQTHITHTHTRSGTQEDPKYQAARRVRNPEARLRKFLQVRTPCA